MYTRSKIAEQSIPSSTVFDDISASLEPPIFVDEDLDLFEIGSEVSWSEPFDTMGATRYRVYLAKDTLGRNRTRVGGDVLGGTNKLIIPSNTELDDFTHVIVYLVTSAAEWKRRRCQSPS